MTKAVDLTSNSLSGPDQIAKDATLLGGYAYQIIRQQSKKVFKLRSHVLADTDIEHLHDMRIGTRKLRAALLLFSDVIKPIDNADAKSITALAGPVKQLTKALGKVRDFDVMQAWFAAALEASAKETATKEMAGRETAGLDFSKKEKKTIATLLKKLKKRRKKQFAQMEELLKSSDYKKTVKRCKQWLKQPTFSPAAEASAHANAIGRIVEPLTELLQHPGWQIATRKRSQVLAPNKSITLPKLNQQLDIHGEQLHDLRRQIKQVRYQTEFFRSLYGITYAAQIRELRTLQKVLGGLQDQLVITEFLTAELGDCWAKKLPTLHQSFQASRLELWKQWQPLQAKYLKLGAQLEKDVAA